MQTTSARKEENIIITFHCPCFRYQKPITDKKRMTGAPVLNSLNRGEN
jgi:hypothetical protein